MVLKVDWLSYVYVYVHIYQHKLITNYICAYPSRNNIFLLVLICMIFCVAIVAPPENKKSENGKEDLLLVDLKLPVKHVLSRELQVFSYSSNSFPFFCCRF